MRNCQAVNRLRVLQIRTYWMLWHHWGNRLRKRSKKACHRVLEARFRMLWVSSSLKRTRRNRNWLRKIKIRNRRKWPRRREVSIRKGRKNRRNWWRRSVQRTFRQCNYRRAHISRTCLDDSKVSSPSIWLAPLRPIDSISPKRSIRVKKCWKSNIQAWSCVFNRVNSK